MMDSLMNAAGGSLMCLPSLWRSHCSRWLVVLLLTGLGAPLPAATVQGRQPTLLVVGDSLSAEYGLQRGKGWVALLEAQLAAGPRGALKVVNASISGDTTSGGRSRLPAALAQHQPAVVVIELGGNDALRGLPLTMTEANLREMTRTARTAGAKVLLLGMQLPPNYGKKYGNDFAALYARVAKEEGAALVPFFLQGVADGPDPLKLFQADRIHPNETAQPLMLDNVWPVLKPLLR
jgi:acyl-CoA thioesterase I